MNYPHAALKDVCTFRHGGTPSRSNPGFWSGDIPWVSPKDMKSALLTTAEDSITQAGVDGSATSVVPEGAILVVARSGILAHSLPVARVARPVAFNQDIKAIQVASDSVSSEYVYWFLRGKAPEILARGVKKGATVHSLQSGFLEQLTIPLAPLSEQRRIVELLSRAENIVRMRVDAQEKAKEIGPALFLEMFGDPVTNPKGWPRTALGELVRNLDASRRPVKASDRASMGGAFPYYGASGIIDYVDQYTHTEPALLVAEDGANLISRSTPIAFQASGRYWVNNHAHVMGETNRATLTYLEFALNLRNLREFVTGSAQPKLTQAALMGIPIALPSIKAQQSFAERASSVGGTCALQTEARKCAERTCQSLLSAAFAERRSDRT